MRRREFLGGLSSAAAAWPLAARAQQGERVRRIGILQAGSPNSVTNARNAAFLEGLQQLGWVEGQNIQIEYRYGSGNPDKLRQYATELVALAPDVILASGGSAARPLQLATHTVPIVFAIVADPVGSGLVKSLSRPGGNLTGLIVGEYNLSGKWLQLLKEIAPTVVRVAVLRDNTISAGIGQFAVIQSVAPSLGVDVSPINIRDAGEIERDIAAFARIPNGGLIQTSTPLANVHRDLIVRLAARHKLPAVYSSRSFVTRGGLISYGANYFDLFRLSAGYVDRILKGEKPADLPVQAPTKYELAINLKTAKALGLTVPAPLLATANEVIE
jgi:putative ABC transport system substrate-binding protein